jgi:WD40 repeat protein
VSGPRIRFVAIDPEGTYAAGGNVPGTVRVWRIRDGKHMATLQTRFSLRAIALSRDGILGTVTDGNEAELWNVLDGQRLARLSGHRSGINSIEFSTDGTIVVTASDDGTARVWGVSDAETRAVFREGRLGRALDASFDRSARRIVVAASDGSSDIYACPVCGGTEELFRFAERQAPRTP